MMTRPWVANSCRAGALLVALGGCDVEPVVAPSSCTYAPGVPSERGFVLVSNDTGYASTNVSLIDPAGHVLAPSIFSSRTASATISQPLSGDVVAPSVAPASGEAVLLDRRAGVVTWLDTARCAVRAQLAVSAGAYTNPHDYLEVGEGRARKAYVTRYDEDLRAAELDRGGDVLVIDPLAARPLRRISFDSMLPASTGKPRPSRLVPLGPYALVSLTAFNATYTEAADASFIAIDSATDIALPAVSAPGVQNCDALAVLDEQRAVAVCSGLAEAGRFTARSARTSALVVIARDPSGIHIERVLMAPALGTRALFFDTLTSLDAAHVVVLEAGDDDVGAPDRWLVVDLEAGLVTQEIASSPKALSLWNFRCLRLPDTPTRCVGADARANVLRPYVWDATAARLVPLAAVATPDPFGLAPHLLAPF